EAGLVARGLLQEKRAEVDEFMRLVELEAFANAYPHHLSGGMAQRVALARALINHPKVLLLDEPLGALDAFTRMRLQDEVLRLWSARRSTTLLVTHDIDEAIYMSDRIIIMTPRPGKIDQNITIELKRPRHRTSSELLHFFDNDELFAGGNVSYEPLEEMFRPARVGSIAGENTPIYLYWRPALPRIRDYNPAMKFIVILRNPIERAFSQWNMQRTRRIE